MTPMIITYIAFATIVVVIASIAYYFYVNDKVTDTWLMERGFVRLSGSIITSYSIDISFFEEYKTISLTIEPGNQCVYVRQGILDRERHFDDVVTVFNGDHDGDITCGYIRDLYKVMHKKELKRLC